MPAASALCVCLCLNASRRIECFKVAYTKCNYITGVSGSAPLNIDTAASELFLPRFDNANTM